MTTEDLRRLREEVATKDGTYISHVGGNIELGLDEWHRLLDRIDALERALGAATEWHDLRDVFPTDDIGTPETRRVEKAYQAARAALSAAP